MEDIVESPLPSQPVIRLPLDTSTINYESQDEKEDSELQIHWHRVMRKANYQTSTLYMKVEVLMLSWEESCGDMNTKEEINRLRSTFEEKFEFHVVVQYLNHTLPQRLQARANAIVGRFMYDYDGPNILLIVYYAGHARLAENHGGLQLFGFVDYPRGAT